MGDFRIRTEVNGRVLEVSAPTLEGVLALRDRTREAESTTFQSPSLPWVDPRKNADDFASSVYQSARKAFWEKIAAQLDVERRTQALQKAFAKRGKQILADLEQMASEQRATGRIAAGQPAPSGKPKRRERWAAARKRDGSIVMELKGARRIKRAPAKKRRGSK